MLSTMPATPLLYLAADHAGFALKETVKQVLLLKGVQVEDLTPVLNEQDDYPLVGVQAAKKMLSTKNSQAVILCGTGFGIAIAANRVVGARAVVAQQPEDAQMARSHNHANILALGGRTLSPRKVPAILEAWLNTPPDKAARHTRRVRELDELV